jgi:hypothetical protein
MKVHGVVHVLDLERLERVRGRIDVTRDEPHRHANATRSVRQPDHGAMLSGERVERGAHFLSARKGRTPGLSPSHIDGRPDNESLARASLLAVVTCESALERIERIDPQSLVCCLPLPPLTRALAQARILAAY